MCEHEEYIEYRWIKGLWNLYRKDCLLCSKILAFGMSKNPIERCEHKEYVECRWVEGSWNLYRKDCLLCSKTLAFGANKDPIERERLRASFENAIPLKAEN